MSPDTRPFLPTLEVQEWPPECDDYAPPTIAINVDLGTNFSMMITNTMPLSVDILSMINVRKNSASMQFVPKLVDTISALPQNDFLDLAAEHVYMQTAIAHARRIIAARVILCNSPLGFESLKPMRKSLRRVIIQQITAALIGLSTIKRKACERITVQRTREGHVSRRHQRQLPSSLT